jgi:methionyl-tRNA formyltransferase
MGMTGVFSTVPLVALLREGANVVAVLVPGSEPGVQALPPLETGPAELLPLRLSAVAPDIRHLAWANNIPLFEVGSLVDPGQSQLLASLQPALLCVACFPKVLPPAWPKWPTTGAINLHPSLLPAYRGPAPLFWQFRYGEDHTGVTLHWMSQEADCGDLISQQRVPFPDGVEGQDAERLVAEVGAALLVGACRGETLARRPQPEAGASRQGYPTAADRTITPDWAAARAFAFLRGASPWAPFFVEVGGRLFTVGKALDYEPGGALGHPFQIKGLVLSVQMSPGILHCLVQT